MNIFNDYLCNTNTRSHQHHIHCHDTTTIQVRPNCCNQNDHHTAITADYQLPQHSLPQLHQHLRHHQILHDYYAATISVFSISTHYSNPPILFYHHLNYQIAHSVQKSENNAIIPLLLSTCSLLRFSSVHIRDSQIGNSNCKTKRTARKNIQCRTHKSSEAQNTQVHR